MFLNHRIKKKSERKFQLTGAGHDTSPDQEEKNQGSDTLVTLHPNRAHLFRLRRRDTSLAVHTACWRLSNKVLSPEISLRNERNATKESSGDGRCLGKHFTLLPPLLHC